LRNSPDRLETREFPRLEAGPKLNDGADAGVRHDGGDDGAANADDPGHRNKALCRVCGTGNNAVRNGPNRHPTGDDGRDGSCDARRALSPPPVWLRCHGTKSAPRLH